MRRKSIYAIFFLLLLVCSAFSLARNGVASSNKPGGLMIIEAFGSFVYDTVLVDLDKGKKHNLTKGMLDEYDIKYARISFDRKKIAAVIDSDQYPNICIMNIDGSNKDYLFLRPEAKKLNDLNCCGLEWFPDGKNILIDSEFAGRYYRLNLDNLEIQQLHLCEGMNGIVWNLRISKNGKKAIVLFRDGGVHPRISMGRGRIYVIDLENGSNVMLTDESDEIACIDAIRDATKVIALVVENRWKTDSSEEWNLVFRKIDYVDGSFEDIMRFSGEKAGDIWMDFEQFKISQDAKWIASEGNESVNFLSLGDQSIVKKSFIRRSYQKIYDWY